MLAYSTTASSWYAQDELSTCPARPDHVWPARHDVGSGVVLRDRQYGAEVVESDPHPPSSASSSLCHTCSFVRVVAGRLDQVYLLCQNDLLPERYPRQPNRGCEGYTPMRRAADEPAPDPLRSRHGEHG